jgi:hypothetical protein
LGQARPPGESERRLDVGLQEVSAIEQQRFVPGFRQGIGGAIEDVQLRRMALVLAIPAKAVKRRAGQFSIEWHDNDAGAFQHFVELCNRLFAMAGIQHDTSLQIP